MVAWSASHKSGRRFDKRLQHRLQIESRAADDLEHVGGGGLLLQRFAQLVEQPRVLDGDHGLIGKGPHQSDLLSVKGCTSWRHMPTTPIKSFSRKSGTASTVRAFSVLKDDRRKPRLDCDIGDLDRTTFARPPF